MLTAALALASATLVAAASPSATERPWMDAALPPAERAASLLKKMTLAEKLVMLHGPPQGSSTPAEAYVGNVPANTRLGIPPLNLNDGPQGFRDNAHPGTTTAFPSGLTMAASWDTAAMLDWGKGMGKEFVGKGSNVQLGPGLCLARIPRNGRNFEYAAGEDPYLGYHMVNGAIKGIQSEGVIANAKHWVNNNQETNRHGVTEIVDDRTRFEMYYPPFAGAVEAGVGSVMCSYNKINADASQRPGDNGTWSCENPLTLKRDLKERLGFKGWVMSDWGACHSASIMAGLDQEMPHNKYMSEVSIKTGLQDHSITMAAVDDSVSRMLEPMFAVGLFDQPAGTWDYKKLSANVTTAASGMVARKLSAISTVLLKNDGGLLPLSPKKKLAVLGFGSSNAVVHGGGSGSVVPSSIVTPLAGLNAVLDTPAVYNDGTDLAEAARLAAAADVAVVFVATLSHEGSDRLSLSLDDGCLPEDREGRHSNFSFPCVGNNNNQNALVAAVAKAQPNTVVVMSVPGAVLTPWRADAKAILTNFFPGQQAGHAIADVLFGKVNPSAKLPITFPSKENEQRISPAQWPGLPDPADPSSTCSVAAAQGCFTANYSEGLFVGYRFYDEHKLEPAFPFGHGLSYTEFTYSELAVHGRNISMTLENTGGVHGSEVAQLYLAYPRVAAEPPLVLRGFKKVSLAAGAKAAVVFQLAERDTSIWDTPGADWKEVKGTFKVHVGSSSRDIRLNATAVF